MPYPVHDTIAGDYGTSEGAKKAAETRSHGGSGAEYHDQMASHHEQKAEGPATGPAGGTSLYAQNRFSKAHREAASAHRDAASYMRDNPGKSAGSRANYAKELSRKLGVRD